VRKNILHITYDMRIGGTEMVIKNIIDGADKTLFNMSIFCIEKPIGPWGVDLQKSGIVIDAKKRQPGFDTSLIKAIRRQLKENKIDLIHCHQYTPWVYGVLAAIGLKTKVIFTEHGRFYPDSSSWKRQLINPVLNWFTDQVTAISQATKQALVEFENIPEGSIDVIYNGIAPLNVDVEKAQTLRKTLNIPHDHSVLGTVARFDPIKNHTMMLRAFAQVLATNKDCTLLIVGDGEERDNIEQCIKQLNIQKNVILAGYQAKPAEHIAIMDLFLLSSLSEGTSMTLLEAMSMGKPCVVTHAGGNPEIIMNEQNGLVTENDNMHAYAQAISSLVNGAEHAKAFGENGKNIFKQLFSEKVMNTFYKKVYLDE
jgi:glycosyltransferase involved in cell wall biosynthesis